MRTNRQITISWGFARWVELGRERRRHRAQSHRRAESSISRSPIAARQLPRRLDLQRLPHRSPCLPLPSDAPRTHSHPQISRRPRGQRRRRARHCPRRQYFSCSSRAESRRLYPRTLCIPTLRPTRVQFHDDLSDPPRRYLPRLSHLLKYRKVSTLIVAEIRRMFQRAMIRVTPIQLTARTGIR